MMIRHEFLQCQGALLSAIWHDPPSLFSEHLSQADERLQAIQHRLTQIFDRLERRRSEAHKSFGRHSTRHVSIMDDLTSVESRWRKSAELLHSDIQRVMLIIRSLSEGGDRHAAESILAEVAEHYAPKPRRSADHAGGFTHQAAHGFVVEVIPESEWERHAVEAGKLDWDATRTQ
jgi:hypothetical protein